MLTIKSATAPTWDNAEHTSLTLKVVFEEYADSIGEIPFSASPDADTEHGAALFAAAVSGEYGPIAEPVPLTVAEVRASALSAITAACAAEIVGGFTCDALGAAHAYPSKVTDQSNIQARVLSSLLNAADPSWSTTFWCEDAEGQGAYHVHTAAQIQAVGIACEGFINAALSKKASLEAAIATADLEALSAIKW